MYAAGNPLIYIDAKGDSLGPVILKGLTSEDPVLKNRTFFIDSKISDNVKRFVSEANSNFSSLSVNNTFRSQSSSKIKTSNTKSKGLSRHQGGFAIDLNGVSALNDKQLGELTSIAAKYGLYPLKNQNDDKPHFSADPTKHGYADLKAAVDENLTDYNQLVGINWESMSDNNGKIIGITYTNNGSNSSDWINFVKNLINNAKPKKDE